MGTVGGVTAGAFCENIVFGSAEDAIVAAAKLEKGASIHVV